MKRNKKGFTIVELVIVIGVIAILSAILIPTFVNLANKAEDARAKSEVADAYTAYVLDYSDNKKVGEESTGADLANKSQSEVAILRSGSYYHYSTEGESGWVKYDSLPTGTFTSVVDGESDPFTTLYNGCVVGFFA